MFPPDDDCDACVPVYERSLQSSSYTAIAFSSIPFLATFFFVSALVHYKFFPILAGYQHTRDEHYLPSNAPSSLRAAHANHERKKISRQVAAVSFSTTIALATVLMELILCEVSNTINPAARTFALKITVPGLMFLLIVLIPFLEIQSIVRSIGGDFSRTGKGRIPRFPWILQVTGFTAWITMFWWIGHMLPGTHVKELSAQKVGSLSNACLERIGVIGICLMALLSGFASISSPWQCFGARPRPVTDLDLERKQSGLDATNDMLGTKRSRLRALQHKMSDAPQEGFVKKFVGTIRGNADMQEVKALELEISGLETMARSLSSSLGILKARHIATMHAKTNFGRAMVLPNYAFSIYCVYRILMTTFTTLRRFTSPNLTFSNSDPINRFLGLLAKHWDPTLDQAAWSRQISFALTGVILLASFNSVLQTFYLFTRWTPSLLYQAQANLALIVGQICATYVISSALLLRSNLPKEVGSVISGALGTPMDSWFVDRWFEGWFLAGALATALGILVGRKFGAGDGGLGDDWDDLGDMEMGHKRS